MCHLLDTSLKAIHNTTRVAILQFRMYMPFVRYKFESNSQQFPAGCPDATDVYAIC